MWKTIKFINKFVLGICTVFVLSFMGLFVYTPEFLNGDKQYLDENFYIKHSNFFIYLIIIFSIILMSIILIQIAIYIISLEEDKSILNTTINNQKYKLTHMIDDKIENDNSEKINKILDTFIRNNSELISVQIYEYIEVNISNIVKFTIKPTTLKVVREGESVNDIQESYSIDSRKLKEYYKVKNECLKNKSTKVYFKYLQKLIERLKKKEFKDIENKEITDAIIFDYCCLILSCQYYLEENPFTINDISEQFKNKINDTKRNGFLRGLIEKDFHKFTHEGRSKKNNRIYVTKCLSIYNNPHIFVITIDSSVMKRNDYSDFINQIGDKFYKILTKDSKITYNDYK